MVESKEECLNALEKWIPNELFCHNSLHMCSNQPEHYRRNNTGPSCPKPLLRPLLLRRLDFLVI